MTAPLDPNRSRPLAAERSESVPTRASDPRDGAAFRSLLDELQTKASHLEGSARSVDGPRELRGAVDEARSTLEGALQLGERVLEAFRHETLTRGAATPTPPTDEPSSSGSTPPAAP